MGEEERRWYLKDFNNFNFLLLGVTAIIGVVVIFLHLLGYQVAQ